MKKKRKIHPAVIVLYIPAFIGLILTIFIARSSELKKSEDLIESYAKGLANGISSFFIDATTIASAAASLRSAQDLDWEVAGMDFTGFIRSNQFIHRISLIDSDGYIYDAYEAGPYGNRWQEGKRTMDNNDPNAEPVNVADREYFQALVTKNTRAEFSVMINEPFVPTGLTEKAFITSAPIISGGKAVGVVSVAQTALELSHLYEDVTMDFFDKFGDKAHVYLVSYGEQLISDLEFNESYGAYMDRLFGRLEPVSVHELGEDTVSAIRAAVMDDRIIDINLHGKRHFAGGIRIEGTPFAVCLSVLKNQMLYASSHIAIIVLVAFLLSGLAGGIVFFWPAKEKPTPTAGGKNPASKTARDA